MTLDSFFRDLRFGLRALVRRPGFSLIAAASLGVGIGLVATQFSLIDGILLRGLPIADGQRLMHVARRSYGNPDPAFWDGIPYRDSFVYLARQTSFEALAGYNTYSTLNLSGPGRVPSTQAGAPCSANLLDVLRVRPAAGRWFTPQEDQPGQPLRIVLSDRLWRGEFKADPGIIGQTLTVNGEAGLIIGVMPPAFAFPGSMQLWTNLRASPASDPQARKVDREEMVGKLRPGVTLAQATAQFDAITASLAKLWPETNSGHEGISIMKFAFAYSGGGTLTLLYLMLAMTVFILVLACVNVANMLLGRATQRTREMAVRAAVGASRSHVVRELLGEAVILSAAGCAFGLALAWEGARLLQENLVEKMIVPGWFDFRVDYRVVLVAIVATVAAALLAGLVPAWRASKVDLNTALKDDSRAAASIGQGKLTRWLVGSQIALSTGLLIVAAVMGATLYSLRQANIRYDPDHLLVGRIDLQEGTQPTTEARARFFASLLERLKREPGVAAVAVTSRALINSGVRAQVGIEGATYSHENERPQAWLDVVSDGYFALLGTEPVEGRLFDDRDRATTPLVAVVNRSFAGRFWPHSDPLGKRFRSDQTNERWATVVGVVADLQMQGVFAPKGLNEEGFLLSESQMGWGWLDLLVRTNSDPQQLVDPVRRAIASLDPNQPIYAVGTLTSRTAGQLRGFGIIGFMSMIFAGITVFLGSVGVYGVTAQAVSRRTREFGIRMALGSTVGRVLRLVFLQGARQIGAGLAVGLLAGFLMIRPLEALFGSNVTKNPAIFGFVALVVCAVGFLALALPAWRAARIHPMDALRMD
jgi:predicted permease